MRSLLLPLLTEADPINSSEGSIDPLGLYAIADSLGVKLAPGVRERQSHPRFLTAIAVGQVICSQFDKDMISEDGISEPWQVYEWYLVEGLIRTLSNSNEVQGLPGRDKAKRAISDHVPLNASRYLKTPSVFGFHGVYRILADKIGCSKIEVISELEKMGNRFFDIDSPLRKECDNEIFNIIKKYPALREQSGVIIDIVRRFLRTPSFLVRYFPLKDLNQQRDVTGVFKNSDDSGLSLYTVLDDFLRFLVERCGESERILYLEAVDNIQTGSIMGADVHKIYSEDEIQGERSERLVPNVRLVNGQIKQETRKKLMLTFNTPFYPEILIASSVMSEGVDLHLNCRHVIHHDLCWNPSTLEQRTGRIDRIGAKVERCGKPLLVYLPYIAETQDEKMFRVVLDRERWFKVVMGEQYKTDAYTTDKLSERILFPQSAADHLAFRLEI